MTLHDSQLRHFNGRKKADKSYNFTKKDLIMITIAHSPGLQTFEIADLLKMKTGNMAGQLQVLKSRGEVDMIEGGWHIVE